MLIRILRLIIGIALTYGLIHLTLKSTGGNVWNEIISAKKLFLLIALLLFGIASISFPVYRWHLLLRVQGIKLGIINLISLTMIGYFFNLILPGVVSGDLIKILLLSRQTKGKRTEIILTAVLDRTLGLVGLFVIASLMILIYLPVLLTLDEKHRAIQVASITVGFISLCGILVIIFLSFHKDIKSWPKSIHAFLLIIQRRLPESIVTLRIRLVKAFDLYRHNFKTIMTGIILSVIIHSCYAITLFLVGLSVGESTLKFSDYFLATQVSNAVAIIPVTPGGIGVRDATIALFFRAISQSSAKIGVIPVIMTLIILFWRIIGGFVFAVYRFPKKVVDPDSILNQKNFIIRTVK